MAYRDFEDLTRRAAPDKILRHKAFNIARNQKYDGYQRGLFLMVYKCFNGLQRWYQSPFIDSISRSDIDDMQLISKFNKGIRFFNMCYWYL